MLYWSVMIVGKPGACKTTSTGSILLEANRNGFKPAYDSDRLRLEDRVVKDTKGGWTDEKHNIHGPHSFLIDGNKPPGRKVFQVTDGTMLNQEHDEMTRLALTHRNREGMIFEVALGNDKHFLDAPDDPLLQSGESFLRRLSGFKVGHDRRLVILEINADKEYRLQRNGIRIDGMAEETIEAFFGDGCELEPHRSILPAGVIYHFIDNNPQGVENLMGHLEDFHVQLLRPVLKECRESRWGIEGRPASTMDRGRR